MELSPYILAVAGGFRENIVMFGFDFVVERLFIFANEIIIQRCKLYDGISYKVI